MSLEFDAQSRAECEGNTAVNRRPYNTCQNIAFFRNDLPAAHDFEQVQCIDLSVDGVSFFLNRRPEQERLVISLGTPPDLMFMTAKVVNVGQLYRDGRSSFKIGCQFLNRVDPPQYHWNLELGIIEPFLTARSTLP